MNLSIEERVRVLAGAVATQGEQMQRMMASEHAFGMAVLALVRSHPDPARFAAEFRRVWLDAGSQHSDESHGAIALESIAEALSMLEESCSVPLNVRPRKAG